MFKKQSNFVDIIKQILNISIEIRFRELFEISSELLRQMFRDIINKKVKIMFKKRKVIAQKEIVKEKKMHVKSVKFNFIELIYLKKIVVQVAFFRSMYVIVCSTMNVSIKNVKVKALFNSDAEINYILKKLTNSTQLFIRQEINIIMMNFINKRARFFDIYESIFINIESIIISIFILVIKRSNHELFLIVFFNA